MDSDHSDAYEEPTQKKLKIRIGVGRRRKTETTTRPDFSLKPLFQSAADIDLNDDDDEDASFEQLAENLLPEFVRLRDEGLVKQQEIDGANVVAEQLRPLTRSERIDYITRYSATVGDFAPSAIALRKLKVARHRDKHNVRAPVIEAPMKSGTIKPPQPPREVLPVNPLVIQGLDEIRTTPYSNSFLSRLSVTFPEMPGIISVDWKTVSPWMCLMQDIRNHYAIKSLQVPEPETPSPITYATLHTSHLPQVHDLLTRSFWEGIDVSDSLDFSPERCTVVACYRKLVVGVALICSPRETYIPYLAVRHGWENSGIASFMLHHLITMNPDHDITLHVSANNPAMLLYNRFGFKAEEFILGFYDAFLPSTSPVSKNAFRLRLRHL